MGATVTVTSVSVAPRNVHGLHDAVTLSVSLPSADPSHNGHGVSWSFEVEVDKGQTYVRAYFSHPPLTVTVRNVYVEERSRPSGHDALTIMFGLSEAVLADGQSGQQAGPSFSVAMEAPKGQGVAYAIRHFAGAVIKQMQVTASHHHTDIRRWVIVDPSAAPIAAASA